MSHQTIRDPDYPHSVASPVPRAQLPGDSSRARSLGLRIESIGAVLLATLAGVAASATAQRCPPGPPPAASSLPVDCGEVVATCCSGLSGGLGSPLNRAGYVVALVDARNPPPSCVGGSAGTVDWRPPMYHNENQGVHTWDGFNLGQVFGLTLDNAPEPNIYVTASTIYGEFNNPPGATFGPGGSGAVYRLDGSTGAICLLAQLPNAAEVGLGNVAFSPVGDYLYVSNMDDGLIYRVPINPCPNPDGTVYLTYDHGVDGRVAEDLDAMPDDPSPPPPADGRYTQLGRRVWGVAVNERERRLYYSVWWEHRSSDAHGAEGIVHATESNEVWSVRLDATGAFSPTTARREFTHPVFASSPVGDWSNPASDLSFTPAGNLMLAERTRTADSGQRLVLGPFDAHQSRALEYSGNHLSWSPSPLDKFHVGQFAAGYDNAAGGVVADCDDNVWVSGDALHFPGPFIYGLQRIPSGGNAGVMPPTRHSFLVDLDDAVDIDDKTELGDVAINDCCCMDLTHEEVICDPANPAKVTYTFDVTNRSGQDAEHVVFTPQSPDSSQIIFMPNRQDIAIPDGATKTVSVMVLGTGGLDKLHDVEICFTVTLQTADYEDCCSVQRCITPDCDCLQFVEEDGAIECVEGEPGKFRYTFQLTNLTATDIVEHLYFNPPAGVTIDTGNPSADYLPIVPALHPGQTSAPITVLICYDPDTDPGDKLTMFVTIHDRLLIECCSREICIYLPDCDDGATGACCFCEDFLITCESLTQDECAARRGTYFGDDSDCPFVCEEIVGACCFADGSCFETFECACFVDGGLFLGAGSSCADCPPGPCPGDCNHDGAVNVGDLIILLSQWGPCEGCQEDIDGDGSVSVGDLIVLLSNWGACD